MCKNGLLGISRYFANIGCCVAWESNALLYGGKTFYIDDRGNPFIFYAMHRLIK